MTHGLGAPAWVCFAVVVLWTPLHFWALAARYRNDYAAAGVPMLPVVAGHAQVGTQMVAYAVSTVAATVVLGPLAHLGLAYETAAGILGVWFMASVGGFAWGKRRPMVVFRDSIVYLSLWSLITVAAALVVPLPRLLQ